MAAAGAVAPPRRVCHAFDCGTFGCGCYTSDCTHCVTTQYLPMHTHNAECLRLVAAHEAARGAPYELVIKLRPDMNITRPFPTLDELFQRTSRPEAPPALCTVGGGSSPDDQTPLAQLPLTMDDKFALMPRRVAAVYMNASRAFRECQAREVNALDCGDGGRMGLPAGKPMGKPMRGLLLAKGQMAGPGARGNTAAGPGKAAAFKGARTKMMRKRALSSRSGAERPSHSPYWATPQCILKRHLIRALPDLRMFDCLRVEGGPRGPPVRLIRP